MIKSKSEIFSILYFSDTAEKETFDNYLLYKGVFLHKHVYEVLRQYRDKVTYKELSAYIKYDKGLRNVLYRYMSAIEEYYRSMLINNFDIVNRIVDLQKESVNVSDLIVSNKVTSNLYKFTFSKKFTFYKLLDLLKGKNLINKKTYTDLNVIRDFRNKVMHHNFVILSYFEQREKIEENISIIEGLCSLIYNALPDSMSITFENSINKCNYLTNKNRVANLDILCLGEMSNGIFK